MDMDVDLVLALVVITSCGKADRHAKPDLDWFPYTFQEQMISDHAASAPPRRTSAYAERVDDSGMLMRILNYCEGFLVAKCPKQAYAKLGIVSVTPIKI